MNKGILDTRYYWAFCVRDILEDRINELLEKDIIGGEDELYSVCLNIAVRFMNSWQWHDTSQSGYDCLCDYLDDNEETINQILSNPTEYYDKIVSAKEDGLKNKTKRESWGY